MEASFDTTAAATPADGLESLDGVAMRTTQEIVRDRLRHGILSGSLKPGTRLVLADLSARLRVSKTPIREALRDLAGQGLVDMDSYRSTVVHRVTPQEARDIYELRLVLEPIAVRKVVPVIAPDRIEAGRRLTKLMEAERDVAEWVDLNRQFHSVLLDVHDNQRLTSIITGLRDAAAVQVAASLRSRPAQMAQANDDHRLILAAFEARDVERADALTRRHLESTMDVIETTAGDGAG